MYPSVPLVRAGGENSTLAAFDVSMAASDVENESRSTETAVTPSPLKTIIYTTATDSIFFILPHAYICYSLLKISLVYARQYHQL